MQREWEKGATLNLNSRQGRKSCNGQANQGVGRKYKSQDCLNSSEMNGKDLVDGDPQGGDKPLDPDGGRGESSAGDSPRQGPIRREISWSWTSLFGVKLSGNYSLLGVHNISEPEKGRSIKVLDPMIEHNINLMALTLVGKILGPRPNIDVVRVFAKRKWALKGQMEITTMSTGALSMFF